MHKSNCDTPPQPKKQLSKDIADELASVKLRKTAESAGPVPSDVPQGDQQDLQVSGRARGIICVVVWWPPS